MPKGPNKRLSWAIIALTALAFYVLLLVTPYYGDDGWYMFTTRGWHLGWTEDFPWQGLWRDACMRWWYDSPRLGNLLTPLLLAAVPKWLLDAVCAFCVGALIRLGLRLANMRLDSVMAVALMAVAVIMVLPWHHGGLCMVFMINYLWSAVLMLWVMCLWWAPAHRVSRSRGWWQLLLGVAASWMYEGVGIALIIGAAFWWLCNPRRHSLAINGRWWLLTGLIIGLWHLASPGFIYWRTVEMTWYTEISGAWRNIVFGNYPAVAAVVIMMVMLLLPRGRRWLKDLSAGPLWCLAVMTAIFIVVSYRCGIFIPRFNFLPRLLSLVILLMLGRAVVAPLRGLLAQITACAVTLLLLIHLGGAAYYSDMAARQNDRVMHEFITTGRTQMHGLAITHPYAMPWWVYPHAGDATMLSPWPPLMPMQDLYGPMPPIQLRIHNS